MAPATPETRPAIRSSVSKIPLPIPANSSPTPPGTPDRQESPISWSDALSEISGSSRKHTPRESMISMPASERRSHSPTSGGIPRSTRYRSRAGSSTPGSESDSASKHGSYSPNRETDRRIPTLEAKTRVLEREADALRLKNKLLLACLTQQAHVASTQVMESNRSSAGSGSDAGAVENQRLLEQNAALLEQTKKLQRRIKVLSLANSALVEKNNELSFNLKEQRHLVGLMKEIRP